MQRLEIKDQVQLADILKKPIQCLHVYLDQIDQGKGAFRAGAYDNEIECRIVTVGNEGWDIVMWCRGRLRGGGCGLGTKQRR